MRARRAREITAAVERAQGMGHSVVMPSYTMPHKAGEPLEVTLGYLQAAWRRMWGGRWAEAFHARYDVVGAIRALEVTYGENGWHPHYHQVVFMRLPAVEADLVELWIDLYRRWCECVEGVCGRRPSFKNGVDVRPVADADAVGDYVADGAGWSVGSELACSPVKVARGGTSVTMFNLLGAAAMWGDADARDLWLEYERATAKRHAVQASKGLMDFYGVEEADDDQAAAPEAVTVVASVQVDVTDWVVMAELHLCDAFVMLVEQWAADGAGLPPDGRGFLLDVLAERRRR